MKRLYKLALGALFLIASMSSPAQVGDGSGLNSLVLKLFGKQNNFTVESEIRMLQTNVTFVVSGIPRTNQLPETVTFMTIAVSSGKIRADVDLTKMRAPGMTPQNVVMLKSNKLDRLVKIDRQDKGNLTILYPGLKLYEQSPLSKEVTQSSAIARIEKTPLGKDNFEGHACTRNRVRLFDAKGNSQDLLTWEADDLNKFPLKVQLVEGIQPLVIINRNVKFGTPSASLFEIPSGYKAGRPKFN
jgi:hypothetical protein